MKPLTLTFVEQYIDEEPKENYWRGITAYIGEDWVIRMTYYPQKKQFSEPTHFEFDTCLSMSGSDFMEKFRGLSIKTTEEAKTKAQELFNEYVYSLCMDEPSSEGGATTAELMMVLGKPLDEALDIHNEVEKLAQPPNFHAIIKKGTKNDPEWMIHCNPTGKQFELCLEDDNLPDFQPYPELINKDELEEMGGELIEIELKIL